jgi:hypothetical protein
MANNYKLEKIWNETTLALPRYYPCFCLKVPKKTTKNLNRVEWGTMLQTVRSRFLFSFRSLNFFSVPNSSCLTMALGSTKPVTEMTTRSPPGVKLRSALSARLTIFCHLWADYLESQGTSTSYNTLTSKTYNRERQAFIRFFPAFQLRTDRLWILPSFYPVGTGDSFLGI